MRGRDLKLSIRLQLVSLFGPLLLPALAREVHKIKSAARLVGTLELADAAKALEAVPRAILVACTRSAPISTRPSRNSSCSCRANSTWPEEATFAQAD